MSKRLCRLEFVCPPPNGGFGRREWYWRFIAANGKETARSSETYRNRVDAIRSAELTTGCYGVRLYEPDGFCCRLLRERDGVGNRLLERVDVRWLR